MVRSIAIVSYGQGTGKTTLALNLGLALHQLNHKVLVFDSDFTQKNMLDHLDIQNMPINIGQVLNDNAHINDAVYRHITGLKIIPSAIHDYDNFSYHYEDLLADYDYIILDTPVQPLNMELVLKNADEALIVHSPEFSSKIVSDAINTLARLKILNLGIVLNKFSENSTNELFDYPIIEKIPLHKDITKSYQLKNPVVHTHPHSKVSKQFHRIAKKLG
jgi:septum site-determining protein MinD